MAEIKLFVDTITHNSSSYQDSKNLNWSQLRNSDNREIGVKSQQEMPRHAIHFSFYWNGPMHFTLYIRITRKNTFGHPRNITFHFKLELLCQVVQIIYKPTTFCIKHWWRQGRYQLTTSLLLTPIRQIGLHHQHFLQCWHWQYNKHVCCILRW